MEENMEHPESGGVSPVTPAPKKKSGTTGWIIIVIVLIIALALLWWQFGVEQEAMIDESGSQETMEILPTEVSPEVPLDTLEDTTPVINHELESIDTGDLESEFEMINQDLENL